MAQQTVNLGTVANDGTGDTLRVGGDKINDNFTELYAADAAIVSGVDAFDSFPAVAISGNYLSSDTQAFTTGVASAMSTGTLLFFPFSKKVIIDALGMEITVAAAGTIRGGLYTSNATTGLPDVLIEQAADVASNTTGLKVLSLAGNLTVTDRIWLALTCSANITARGGVASGVATSIFGATTLATAPVTRLNATFVFAALPANTSGLTFTQSTGLSICAARVH